MRRRVAALTLAVFALGGCQTVGDFYDGIFGGSSPAQKPAELTSFTATAEARIAWQANVGGAERFAFAPSVRGASVFAASAAGEVMKLDLATGKTEWRTNAGTRISTGPGTDGRLVALGSPRGEVIAIDASGQTLWKAQLSGEILSTPAVEEGIVAVKSGDGRVYGLSAQDGRRRWVYQRSLPALMVRSPAGISIMRGGVFCGFPGGKLAALIANSGALAWEATVSTPRGSTELERMTDIVGAPLIDGRSVCAVSYQGRAGCFDALKGTQLWIREMSSVMALTADNRHIYATDDKSAVHALDKASGASIWKQDRLSGRGVTGAAVVGSWVAVGDYQGYVHFLNRSDGAMAARIATDSSPILLPPVTAGDNVLVQTRNGGLFSISVR